MTRNNRIERRFAPWVACLLCFSCSTLFAQTEELTLIISDVDVRYDLSSGLVFDEPVELGGELDPLESDSAVSTVFEVDGDVVFTLPTEEEESIYVDFAAGTLPASFYEPFISEQGFPDGGFGLDWFTGEGTEFSLRLALEQVDVTQTTSVFFLSTQGAVEDQALPNGMLVVGPVEVAFLSTAPNFVTGEDGALDVVASGALLITAVLIPEPTALVLLFSAGATALALRRPSRN